MATVTGLTIVREFPYRDQLQEEFSNTYHFKGPPPGDNASWLVLLNDIVTLEKTAFAADVKYVRAYGYDSNDDGAHHVFAHDWTVTGPQPAGTFVPGASDDPCAGDQAALLWWLTDMKNSRGKPVYLRKYFHGPYVSKSTTGDALSTDYRAAIANVATSMNAHHGGLRSAANDLNVVAPGTSQWVTTRTLKRRGKRPLP